MPKPLPGGQSANQNAWWNTKILKDGAPIGMDVLLHDFTPPLSGPRQSEGLIHADQVINRPDLYIVFPTQEAAGASVVGRKAAQAYAKGPNDSLGTAGWANDYYDIAGNTRWPVLMNTPAHIEGVTHYYLPVNGGKYNYAEFSLSRDNAAIGAREAAVAPTGGGGGGGGVYVDSGATGATGGTARRAMELTMLRDGRFFYATTDAESKGLDSPHPRISVAGKDKWPASFGKPSEQGLPDGLYLLSVSPYDATPEDAASVNSDGVPEIVVPASKALKAAMAAAMNGDEGAIEALTALDIQPPHRSGFGGVLDNLEDLFR